MKKLPDGWKIVKLSDIANISVGGTPSRNIQEYWKEGNIPWLKISDLKNTFINHAEEKITQNGLDNSSAKIFPKGTIVYSIFATLGAVGILEISTATNQAIAGIIPENTLIDTKYLYYCLKSEKNNILAKKSHATQDNINLTILKNHEILLPPLPTQKKIAATLEKAEKLREWRKEADGLTNEFLKNTFLDIFGDLGKNEKRWDKRQLKECIEIPLNSGLSPICSDVAGGIPVFSLANLSEHGLINNVSKYYYGNQPSKGLDLKIGDILVSRSNTRDLVGRVGMYRGAPEKVIYPDLMIRIRLNRNILNPNFFEEYLRTNSMRESIQRLAHGTSGSMVKISQKNLMDLQIITPPIALQQKFARIVQQVEQIRERQTQSRQHIDNLFNALMQRAFRGELEA